jgi:hypothetical protein
MMVALERLENNKIINIDNEGMDILLNICIINNSVN